MNKEARVYAPAVLPIKERLLIRFKRARVIVGQNWREKLAKSDPFFNTMEGVNYMRSVGQAVTDKARSDVDRIERVTIALEKLAGIESAPVC